MPFTVKQNIDLAGSATNWGMPALAEAVPAADSPVVERMRRAGAIPIGRTNCPDMALRVHTDSGLHGVTRNPWRSDVTAGGSSGGEASALAAGMTPIGLGNDIGGSLRNPATCCGIASLKPSAGIVPGYTTIPGADAALAFQLMPVEGPMARTVADVRLGLVILAGRDRRDPHSVPTPPRPAAARGSPAARRPPRRPARRHHRSRRRGADEAAADALADAGYDVVTTPPPRYEDVIATWTDFIVSDIRLMRELIAPMMGADAIGFLDAVLDARPPMDLAAYAGVMMARQGLMREWALWFADVDVLLTPTWTQLPFVSGWDASSPERAVQTLELMRPVAARQRPRPAVGVRAGRPRRRPAGRRAPHRRPLRRRDGPRRGGRHRRRPRPRHPDRPDRLTARRRPARHTTLTCSRKAAYMEGQPTAAHPSKETPMPHDARHAAIRHRIGIAPTPPTSTPAWPPTTGCGGGGRRMSAARAPSATRCRSTSAAPIARASWRCAS